MFFDIALESNLILHVFIKLSNFTNILKQHPELHVELIILIAPIIDYNH